MIRSAVVLGVLLGVLVGCGSEGPEAPRQAASGELGVARAASTTDTSPPSLAFQEPYDGKVFASGSLNGLVEVDVVVGVYDESPITSVTMEGGTTTLTETSPGSQLYTGKLKLPQEGRYTYQVVATDSAGNVATSPVRTIIRDEQPPVLTITSPTNPGYIQDTQVEIKGVVTDVTTQSVQIGSEFIPLAPDGSFSHTVSLTLGQQNYFYVAAMDQMDRSVYIMLEVWSNTTPPTLSVSAPATNLLTNQAAVTVSGNATAAMWHDQVKVTVAGLLASETNGGFSKSVPLVYGPNTLLVSAVDAYGLRTEQSLLVTRDDQAPVIDIDGLPESGVSASAVTFSWSVTDLSLVGKQVLLDEVPLTDADSPVTVTAEGEHTLFIEATDAFGLKTTVTKTFFVDYTAPAIGVGGIPADGLSQAAQLNVVITVEDDTPESVTAVLSTAALPYPPPLTGVDSLPLLVEGEGAYTLSIEATDKANRKTTRVVHFTIDRSDPVIVVTGVQDQDLLNEAVTVKVAIEDLSLVSSSLVVDSVERPMPEFEVTTEGPHTVSVTATDHFGRNTTRNLGFKLDFTHPTITFQGVDAGMYSNALQVTPGFEASDPNGIASVSALLGGSPFDAGTAVDGEGEHTLVVTAVDKAQNPWSESLTFTLDRIKPTITVTNVEPGGRYNIGVTPAFTVTDVNPEPTKVSATLNGTPFDGGTVSAPGGYDLVITAEDKAGNQRELTTSFTIDLTKPQLALVSPNAGSILDGTSTPVTLSASDEGPVASVKVGLLDLTSSVDGGFYTETLSLAAEGPNHFQAVAHDQAGNSETLGFTLTRDTLAPVLTVESPADKAVVNRASVEVQGTVVDGTAVTLSLNGGPAEQVAAPGDFSRTVTLVPGKNTLTLVATDAVNHVTTVTREVFVVLEPPTVVVSEPASGSMTTAESVTVKGHAQSGIPQDPQFSVKVNGHDVTPANGGGNFEKTVMLPLGTSTIVVRAVDGLQKVTQVSVDITRMRDPQADAGTLLDAGSPLPGFDGGSDEGDGDTPDEETPPPSNPGSGSDAGSGPVSGTSPVLVVEGPEQGAVFGGNSFAAHGRVEEGTPPFRMIISGPTLSDVEVPVNTRSFSASLSLAEGTHSLLLRVEDAQGREVTATRTVSVDQHDPLLRIIDPDLDAGTSFPVSESPAFIKGEALDPHLASVTVNGGEVRVIGGQFIAAVPIVAEETSVTVVARDLAGNQSQQLLEFTAAGVPPTVVITHPRDGFESPTPLVEVRAQVTPVGEATVQKVFIQTGEAQQDGGTYFAQVPLVLGENTLTVSALDSQGVTGTKRVRVRFRDATKEPLAVTGVSPELGEQDVQPNALVSVSFNKPIDVDELEEYFTVKRDGEPLPGGYSVAPGAQTATFIARDPLPEGARLVVEVEDGLEPTAGPLMTRSFTSDFVVRRPLTRVRGSVTDADFRPLAGVRVIAEDRALSTVTGPDGNWTMFAPKGGEFVLRYEGVVTSDGRNFPTVRRRLYVTEGTETVDRPLALTPVDKASAQLVDAMGRLQVDFAGRHPGLSLDVPANSLFFADGSVRGVLTATELAPHTLPVPMEGRASLAGLWQIGPSGVRVQGPMDVTLPNRTGLTPGRLALLLAYDDRQHVLRRVGFGRVRMSDNRIVPTQQLALGALEMLGYMPLDDAQHTAVEKALAQAGGSGGTPLPSLDGGHGMRLPGGLKPAPTPAWKTFLNMVGVGKAHAQGLAGMFPVYSVLDNILTKTIPGYVEGYVRAPLERYLVLELQQPEPALFNENLPPRPVELPYLLPLKLAAHFENPDPLDANSPPLVSIAVQAEGPLGALVPPENALWQAVGQAQANLDTTVALPVGKTTITVTSSTGSQVRKLVFEATLTQNDTGTGGTLLLKRLQGGTDLELDESVVNSPIRFQGLRVTVTGPGAEESRETGPKGGYGIPVMVFGGEQMGISCTEVPVGPKVVERVDAEGVVHFEVSKQQFGVCSPTYSLQSGRSVRADIVVDVRMIHGLLKFVNRHGEVLDGDCAPGAKSEPSDEVTGEFSTIARDDLAKTEVHFFRQDDLKNPIAKFAIGEVNPLACQSGAYQNGKEHGQYRRVRIGPASQSKSYARQRCRELDAKNGELSDSEKSYYAANCADDRTNYLRLAAGDQLAVFAVNHATGYSGMTTVTVPPINRSTRDASGNCPADDALGGPLQVSEFGQTMYLSRCTQAELGIPANITLYPPEVDIRVERRRKAEGLAATMGPSLVRHGGAATTGDDYLQVSTHWRVRQVPAPMPPESDGGLETDEPDAGSDYLPDGGLDVQVWCGHDRYMPDGGACPPGSLVDVGDAGTPLEVYCSELPERSAQRILGQCDQDTPQLVEVPAGVPPMAGRVVRVTGTAVEQPAVVTFPVRPGRNTATVQASLRYQDESGQKVTLSSLPRANYYVHVVGYPLLQRDQNGDGYLQTTEENAPPPDFTDFGMSAGPTKLGLPKLALGLKNVYRGIEKDGTALERFDRALEHEFRVLDLGPVKITAQGSNSTRDLEGDRPAASDDDLAYEFLMSQLLTPDNPGRAGTLNGEYVLRLGTDSYGIDCPIKVNATAHTLSGTCEGEFLPEILSASDILYFELYLSGNAENVLYRFNFQGLTPRSDFVTAGGVNTVEQSLAKTPPSASLRSLTATAVPLDRPISQRPFAMFAVDPNQFTTGVIRICEGNDCSKDKALLKLARLKLVGNTFKVAEWCPPNDPDRADPEKCLQEGAEWLEASTERIKEKVFQFAKPGARNARRFSLRLPNDVGTMVGVPRASTPLFLKLQSDPLGSLLPPPPPEVIELGEPLGRYLFVNARPNGQPQVSGVNLAGGQLSFAHEDFAIPQLGEVVRFVRTYNNQNNILGPLGSGWTHNYEGFVFEEELGRYTVVLNGQSYDFPICQTISKGKASRCLTDKSHGGSLTVGVKPDGTPNVTFASQHGWLYKFDQESVLSQEGRRRWVLTAYSDGNEAPWPDLNGNKVQDEDELYDLNKGWTRLAYVEQSDRVQRVWREPGKLILIFDYTPVSDPAEGYNALVRLKSRTENFELLSWVSIYRRQDVPDPKKADPTKALHRVQLYHDKQGNLRRAERVTDLPRQAWAYEYRQVPESAQGYSRWRISNEMEDVWLQHSASALPATGPLSFYDQWAASYSSSGWSRTYEHVESAEIVETVNLSDQGPGSFKIGYFAYTGRTVTRPDGLKVTLHLNEKGNETSQKVGELNARETIWKPDQISPARVTLPNGGVLSYNIDEKHHFKGETMVTPPGEGARQTDGLGANKPIVSQDPHPRFGIPTVRRFTGHDGAFFTIETSLAPHGAVENVSIKDSQNHEVYKEGPRYFDAENEGVVLSETDAAGRLITYEKDSRSDLGLPRRILITYSGGVSTDPEFPEPPGLLTLSRELEYDRWGRLISSKEVETGASESWTYDGLGRVLTHTVTGEPDLHWRYEYKAGHMSLEVREFFGPEALKDPKAEPEPLPSRLLSSETRDGSLGGSFSREVRYYGHPVRKEAIRTRHVKNGRLESTSTATDIWRTYEYDAIGRLVAIHTNKKDGTRLGTEVRYQSLDSNGNPRSILDHNGLMTQVAYDYLGRPVAWDYGGGDAESVKLDLFGAVTYQAFGNPATSHELMMKPDPLGHTLSSWSVNESIQSVNSFSQFDTQGRVTYSQDSVTGMAEWYEYKDVLGRLTRYERQGVSTSGTPLTLVERRTYRYETVGGKRRLKVQSLRTIKTGLAAPNHERAETHTQYFDSSGRLLSEVSKVGAADAPREYMYDTRGNLTRIRTRIDSTNVEAKDWESTTFEYDDAGYVYSKTEPGDAVTVFTVNGEGQVEAQVGPHPKEEWAFKYDSFGQLTEKTLTPTDITLPTSTWKYEYGKPVSSEESGIPNVAEVETDPLGRETTRFFNARYKLLKEVREDKAPAGSGLPVSQNRLITLLTYDGPWLRKQEVTEETGIGSPGRWRSTLSRPTIDTRGRTLRQEEHWQRGVSGGEEYKYITETAWTGRTGVVTETWLTPSFSSSSSPQEVSRTSVVQVDSLGNVVSREQGGLTDSWLYDAAGLLTKSQPSGLPETRHTYEQGLLKHVAFNPGAEQELTQLAYRLDGRVKSITDPAGRVRSFTYGPRGLVEKETYGRGTETQTTKYAYDTGGSLEKVWQAWEHADQKEWSFVHGPMGELLKVTLPPDGGALGSIEYEYDSLGQLTHIKPFGAMPSQSFEYDYLGRLRSQRRGASTWTVEWTNGASLQTSPDNKAASGAPTADQDKVEVLLDGRGRMAWKKLTPGPGTAAQQDLTQASYTYDGLDQPLQVKEARSSGQVLEAFTYDVRNRLKTVTRGTEHPVTYEYLSGSDLLEWQKTGQNGARTVKYGYDATSKRLSTLLTARGEVQVAFESGGERLTRVQDGAATECYQYDGRGWLKAVWSVAADVLCTAEVTAPLASFDYVYDGRGNRLEEHYVAGTSSPQVTRYGYDAADRLTGVRYPDNKARLYELEADGTRKAEKHLTAYEGALTRGAFATAPSPQVHWSYKHDGSGGLSGLWSVSGSTSTEVSAFVTDATGRLRREHQISDGLIKEYGWDADGRLAHFTKSLGTATLANSRHRYDHAGLRRSTELVGSTTPTGDPIATRYVWAGGELLEEQLRDGTSLPYERVGGLAIAVGGERVLHDGLGSAVARKSGSSGSLTRYRYDAWGAYQDGTSSPSVNEPGLGYTGHGFDVDSGLVYAQQRWYSPQLGRFMSEDPLFGDTANPTSLHPFGYANGNPTRYTDPDGRVANVAIGAIAGAVIGCGIGAWSAEAGNGLDGCLMGGAIGGVTGALAGATFGATFALTAKYSIGAVTIDGVTGSAAIASTTAGAVGAYTSTTASGYFLGGKSFWAAHETGMIAAPIGAVGGVVGYGIGHGGGYIAGKFGAEGLVRQGARELAEGFSDDIISQGLGLGVGLQDQIYYANPLALSALGTGFRGTRHLADHHLPAIANPFNYRLASLSREPGVAHGVMFPFMPEYAGPSVTRLGRSIDYRSTTAALRERDAAALSRLTALAKATNRVYHPLASELSPYQTPINPRIPGRPDPTRTIDSMQFRNPRGHNAQGYPRDPGEFWRLWLEMRPETLSPLNRAFIKGINPKTGRPNKRGPTAPRVDAQWIKYFPEHAKYMKKKLLHHHINQGRYTQPVPGPTHPGSGGPFHGSPVFPKE